MKILFIVTQSEIGGAQRYLLELTRYLSVQNKIAIAAGSGDKELFEMLHETCNMKHVTTHYIPHLVRALNPAKDIIALFAILKLIKRERPDVLLLQSTKAGFLGALAGRIYKIYYYMLHVTCYMRIIYRIGGWSFRDPRSWWMNKILFYMEKISAIWKDAIIVNSEFDKQLAIDKKISSTVKIVKIYNGIDPNRMEFFNKEKARNALVSSIPPTGDLSCLRQTSRRDWPQGDKYSPYGGSLMPTADLPEGLAAGRQVFPLRGISRRKTSTSTIIVGTIANLYATKGLEYLIQSARNLYQILNIKYLILFVVIGEGKERPKLESLIKKYNLENNFFLIGRKKDAYKYLKAFDIFVLPSVKEGMPWAILEAMAAEVPVIATRVGAVPEIIRDGTEGILVPPGNSSAISEKIKILIENPELQKKLVINAVNKLEQFSLKTMLEESEKIICKP